MYKTAVYRLVNAGIMHQKQQILENGDTTRHSAVHGGGGADMARPDNAAPDSASKMTYLCRVGR